MRNEYKTEKTTVEVKEENIIENIKQVITEKYNTVYRSKDIVDQFDEFINNIEFLLICKLIEFEQYKELKKFHTDIAIEKRDELKEKGW